MLKFNKLDGLPQVFRWFRPKYIVGQSNYEKLSQSAPMAIKITNLSGFKYAEEIKKKWMEKMPTEAKCLLDN